MNLNRYHNYYASPAPLAPLHYLTELKVKKEMCSRRRLPDTLLSICLVLSAWLVKKQNKTHNTKSHPAQPKTNYKDISPRDGQHRCSPSFLFSSSLLLPVSSPPRDRLCSHRRRKKTNQAVALMPS